MIAHCPGRGRLTWWGEFFQHWAQSCSRVHTLPTLTKVTEDNFGFGARAEGLGKAEPTSSGGKDAAFL